MADSAALPGSRHDDTTPGIYPLGYSCACVQQGRKPCACYGEASRGLYTLPSSNRRSLEEQQIMLLSKGAGIMTGSPFGGLMNNGIHPHLRPFGYPLRTGSPAAKCTSRGTLPLVCPEPLGSVSTTITKICTRGCSTRSHDPASSLNQAP